MTDKNNQKSQFNELFQALQDRCGFIYHYPVYPFRAGYICKLVSKEEFSKRVKKFRARKPLSPKQIQDIESVLECPLEISSLRAFLKQKCHVANLETLTWPDILSHSDFYLRENYD